MSWSRFSKTSATSNDGGGACFYENMNHLQLCFEDKNKKKEEERKEYTWNWGGKGSRRALMFHGSVDAATVSSDNDKP